MTCNPNPIVWAWPDKTYLRLRPKIRVGTMIIGPVTGLCFGMCLPRFSILVHPRDFAMLAAEYGHTPEEKPKHSTGNTVAILAFFWPWKPKQCQCQRIRNLMNHVGPRTVLGHAREYAAAMSPKASFLLVPVLTTVAMVDLGLDLFRNL